MVIVLYALIDNNSVILVNCYTQNKETDQLKVPYEITHIILNKTEISENTTFIWGSDFDINLDTEVGLPELNIKSVSKLLSMMSENDRNPQEKCLTWQRKTPFKQRRLGFFQYLVCFNTT